MVRNILKSMANFLSNIIFFIDIIFNSFANSLSCFFLSLIYF